MVKTLIGRILFASHWNRVAHFGVRSHARQQRSAQVTCFHCNVWKTFCPLTAAMRQVVAASVSRRLSNSTRTARMRRLAGWHTSNDPRSVGSHKLHNLKTGTSSSLFRIGSEECDFGCVASPHDAYAPHRSKRREPCVSTGLLGGEDWRGTLGAQTPAGANSHVE